MRTSKITHNLPKISVNNNSKWNMLIPNKLIDHLQPKVLYTYPPNISKTITHSRNITQPRQQAHSLHTSQKCEVLVNRNTPGGIRELDEFCQGIINET